MWNILTLPPLITPVHCKMARMAVGYSRSRLGTAANLSAETIRLYERGEKLHINHLAAIFEALQLAGARFVQDADGQICVHPPATQHKDYDPV